MSRSFVASALAAVLALLTNGTAAAQPGALVAYGGALQPNAAGDFAVVLVMTPSAMGNGALCRAILSHYHPQAPVGPAPEGGPPPLYWPIPNGAAPAPRAMAPADCAIASGALGFYDYGTGQYWFNQLGVLGRDPILVVVSRGSNNVECEKGYVYLGDADDTALGHRLITFDAYLSDRSHWRSGVIPGTPSNEDLVARVRQDVRSALGDLFGGSCAT